MPHGLHCTFLGGECVVNFVVKTFQELSTHELYDCLQLRSAVFVVEQHCVYQDLDNKDKNAHHVLGYQDHTLVAYLRVLPKGMSYSEHQSIGRVVTCGSVRGQGVGQQLLQAGIDVCLAHDPDVGIKISAQEYLIDYYGLYQFKVVSDVYLEDGINHVAMIRAPHVLCQQQ